MQDPILEAGGTAPTGTVTFLFTDIEGSTRLWDHYPREMGPALARHDTLMREAIARFGGTVFKTIGDAFCAAFGTAPEAVGAAIAAQRALEAEEWHGLPGLKVRMAIHTGSAEERDGDYFGAPLNRVARLLSAGHGGQVLLSLATQELARDQLPRDIGLRDLGDHHLKDLGRPERVFQVLAPGLPDEFAPLRTLDYYPNNLPIQLTSFVGREREMAAVARALRETRLLSLLGPGGTGKTRLSLQVGADVLDLFPHGVWFVDLAPLSDPALVPQAVSQVLQVREDPAAPLAGVLAGFLKSRELLLILDNCEHLVEACASLADHLLRNCPRLRILTTTRERLGIAGETTYAVPALRLPPDQRHWGRVGLAPHLPDAARSLGQYEAVRLFIERATAVQPHFTVTNQNAPAVAHLCCRLDGIPLALELAAARVKVLTVEEIAARLDDRFRLLTRGSRTALPRQQTLRALIDWSFDLLSEPERVLLRRLSVFAGGLALEAAERVCADPEMDPALEEWEVLDLLTQLADKSLVQVEEDAQGFTRYRLLETVRQYSRERLIEAGEGSALGWSHAHYFLELAERAAPELNRRDQLLWMRRLDEEHDNLRTAYDWLHQEARDTDMPLRLVGALGWFWVRRGFLSEGWGRTEAALAEREGKPPAARLAALHGAVALLYLMGHSETILPLARERLALAQETGDVWHEAFGHFNVGVLVAEAGDVETAWRHVESCLRLANTSGDRWLVGAAHRLQGAIQRARGDSDGAATSFRLALAALREMGDLWSAAFVLSDWGELALHQREADRAEELYREAIELIRPYEDPRALAWALVGLAGVAVLREIPHRAARLLGAAAALMDSVGGTLIPLHQLRHDQVAAEARTALGEEAYNQAWQDGRTLTQSQALGYALRTG